MSRRYSHNAAAISMSPMASMASGTMYELMPIGDERKAQSLPTSNASRAGRVLINAQIAVPLFSEVPPTAFINGLHCQSTPSAHIGPT
jgi:hypothetical protein